MRIEPAQPADIDDISALNKVFRRAADRPDYYESASWVRPHLKDIHVIRDDFGVAAHACIGIYSDYARLEMLSVREDRRQQGMGRALVDHAINLARDAGVPELRVGSGRRFKVKDYYLRQGFEIDDARTNDLNYRFIMKL